MDKDISEAARQMAARRKTKRGGFNSKEVQAKIKQIKAEKRKKNELEQGQA